MRGRSVLLTIACSAMLLAGDFGRPEFFADLDLRLANSYAEEYRNWLMPKA